MVTAIINYTVPPPAYIHQPIIYVPLHSTYIQLWLIYRRSFSAKESLDYGILGQKKTPQNYGFGLFITVFFVHVVMHTFPEYKYMLDLYNTVLSSECSTVKWEY